MGGHLRTAARWASGAAAAYVSISQAKAAISTTQELANTSKLLSRNLGLSVKQASRWASVAQTRDISTKQMNASFATLATRISDARAGSVEAMADFKKLGITQRDLRKDGDNFQATLDRVSDAFGKQKGGADRQATAISLLGRGYQNLLPIMGEGSKALNEQLKLGDKYGATMGKDAVAAQLHLTASLRESQRAWQGLQVQFTTAVTPALEVLNKQFQHVSAIMADPNLTQDEKWSKVAAIIERDMSKAFDVVVELLPEVASRVGEQAPRIAGALVKGFLDANVWGKLALGGWFISKLGIGGAVFEALIRQRAAKAAAAAAAGAAAGEAAGVAGGAAGGAAAAKGAAKGTIISTAGGAIGAGGAGAAGAKFAGPAAQAETAAAGSRLGTLFAGKFGVAAAAAVPITIAAIGTFTQGGVLDTIKGKGHGLGSKFAEGILSTMGPKVSKAIRQGNIPALQELRDQLQKAAVDYKGLDDEGSAAAQHLADVSRRAAHGLTLGNTLATELANNKGNVKAVIDQYGKQFQRLPRLGQAAAIENTKRVGEQFVRLGVITRKQLNNLLDAETRAHRKSRQHWQLWGGAIVDTVQNAATGESEGVRAILGNLNSALKAMGVKPVKFSIKGVVAQLPANAQGLPGLQGPGKQAGGMVVRGSGSGDKVPLQAWVEPKERVFVLNRNASAALENLQGWNAAFPRFARGGQIPMMLMQGPGALRSLGQAGLDKTHGAAAKYLAKHRPKGGGGITGKGSGTALMKDISRRKGWNFADWWALDASETDHGANLVNPTSTARLRGQFLDMNWGKYGPGSDPAQHPSMREQIISMARYIAARYVNPSAAWAFHQSHNYYQRGGAVRGDPHVPDKGRTRRAGPLSRAAGAGPQTLGALIAVANAVNRKHLPYVWGGGHSQPAQLGSGVDCSGAVSYLLQQAGFNVPTQVASGFMSAFKSGPGKDFTIYAANDHVFTGVGGKQWGTSDANPGGGAGWFSGHSTSGFTARHPDLAAVVGATSSGVGLGTGQNTPKLSAKQRRRLDHLKSVIAKLGLHKGLQDRLSKLTGDSERFAELADHAGALSDDTTQTVLQGANQAGWLQEELKTLFALRNALIRAQNVIRKARDKIAKMLDAAGKKKLSPKERQKVQAQLTAELKKPKRRQDPARIAALRAKLASPDVAKALIDTLTGRDSKLASTAGDLGSSLTDVQGLTSPKGAIATLTPQQAVLTFGGQIFDVAKSLIDLGVNNQVTDAGGDSDSAELLRQLLREANLRTAVSEAQIRTLRETPLPPYAGSFAEGGVVPGPPGAPRMIEAHGGEEYLGVGASRSPNVIQVVVEDGAVDHRRIRVIASEETKVEMRRQARGGNRPLAGRAGGLT